MRDRNLVLTRQLLINVKLGQRWGANHDCYLFLGNLLAGDKSIICDV